MKKILIRIIRFYQKNISKYKGVACCRFIPTCSEYAIQAIEKYGAVKGVFKATLRILRCHPFCKGGYDPLD